MVERKLWGTVRLGLVGLVVAAVMSAGRLGVQAADVQSAGAKDLVQKMIEVENAEALRKGRFEYLSKERSERTGGQLWTERVVETSSGKVRRLIAENGQPLTAEQAAAERAKLSGIAADPEGFRKRSQAQKDDEQHAKEMFGLMGKAFVFEGMRTEGESVRIEFKPDPNYEPQSMEERVLHGMVGTVWIDSEELAAAQAGRAATGGCEHRVWTDCDGEGGEQLFHPARAGAGG